MTERESTLHNRRVDDELARETEAITRGAPVPSHTRPDLIAEDPGEDSWATAGAEPGTPEGLSPADIELRSLLAQSLRPNVFPAGRQRLIEVAQDEQAPARVVQLLEGLPDSRHFDVLEEVFEALGGHGEAPTR